MDYPGHRAITDNSGWQTMGPSIGTPAELISIVSINLVAVYAVHQPIF